MSSSSNPAKNPHERISKVCKFAQFVEDAGPPFQQKRRFKAAAPDVRVHAVVRKVLDLCRGFPVQCCGSSEVLVLQSLLYCRAVFLENLFQPFEVLDSGSFADGGATQGQFLSTRLGSEAESEHHCGYGGQFAQHGRASLC